MTSATTRIRIPWLGPLPLLTCAVLLAAVVAGPSATDLGLTVAATRRVALVDASDAARLLIADVDDDAGRKLPCVFVAGGLIVHRSVSSLAADAASHRWVIDRGLFRSRAPPLA